MQRLIRSSALLAEGVTDVPPGSVRVSGQVSASGMGVSGASVEVFAATPANSTTSDVTGAWRLTVTAGLPNYFRASKATFRTTQWGFVADSADCTDLELDLVASANVVQFFGATGLTEDTAAGIVVVSFRMPSTAGNMPAGFGATLSAGGGTHVALGGSGAPVRQDTTLAGATSVLVVVNVAAGMTTVTPVPTAGLTCAPVMGTLNTVRVDPQVLTYVTFECR